MEQPPPQENQVATDKAKLMAYVAPSLKAEIERLADARFRSVSNLVEAVMAKEIKLAIEAGEIPPASHPEPESESKQVSTKES